MAHVGYVPVQMDEQTGDLFVNPNDAQIGGADDEADGVGFLGLGRRDRLSRLENRLEKLTAKRDRLAVKASGDAAEASPADLYQLAASAGMVQENQYDGLGYISMPLSSAGVLQDTVNRNFWAKSLVLDSDTPDAISITSITIAGLPFNIGSQGAPLSMFLTTSTRYGISFGRRLALVGQTFAVNLFNNDSGTAHNASGGLIVDEMNPYAMQRWMEQMLLTAAVQGGFGGFGFY